MRVLQSRFGYTHMTGGPLPKRAGTNWGAAACIAGLTANCSGFRTDTISVGTIRPVELLM